MMVHEVNKIKKRMKLDPNPTAHRKFLLSIEPIDQHRNHNIGQVGYVMDKYSINPIITEIRNHYRNHVHLPAYRFDDTKYMLRDNRLCIVQLVAHSEFEP